MIVRPAATLCLLRPGPNGPEVLMVRRAPSAVFVGGAFVFPGGSVEGADRGEAAGRVVLGAPDRDLRPWMAAALRETAEEAGVWLLAGSRAERGRVPAGRRGEAVYRGLAEAGLAFDAGRLAYLSNWVTPPGPPRRFDTRFFVAAAEPGTEARPDGEEVVEARWIRPADALASGWPMIAPTVEHLRLLSRFSSPAEAVDHARRTSVRRIEPWLRPDGRGGWEVLLPDRPGDEEAVRWR